MVCTAFLLREKPVSSMAKPICMNITRKPVKATQHRFSALSVVISALFVRELAGVDALVSLADASAKPKRRATRWRAPGSKRSASCGPTNCACEPIFRSDRAVSPGSDRRGQPAGPTRARNDRAAAVRWRAARCPLAWDRGRAAARAATAAPHWPWRAATFARSRPRRGGSPVSISNRHGPERVQIGSDVPASAVICSGCHVVRRAQRRRQAKPSDAARRVVQCDAEVQELHHAVRQQHDVFGFQISVHHAVGVQIHERSRDLTCDVQRAWHGQSLLGLQQSAQGSAVDELHCDVLATALVSRQDLHDAGGARAAAQSLARAGSARGRRHRFRSGGVGA